MTARPPAYVCRSTLATEIDIAESTVDEMVRRGVLPRPVHLSAGCVRWCWRDVENALASLKPVADTAPLDPYAVGASNVTNIPEGRRGPAQGRS
jgi:predicted DNA-binding transcriptional regulator AlpA